MPPWLAAADTAALFVLRRRLCLLTFAGPLLPPASSAVTIDTNSTCHPLILPLTLCHPPLPPCCSTGYDFAPGQCATDGPVKGSGWLATGNLKAASMNLQCSFQGSCSVQSDPCYESYKQTVDQSTGAGLCPSNCTWFTVGCTMRPAAAGRCCLPRCMGLACPPARSRLLVSCSSALVSACPPSPQPLMLWGNAEAHGRQRTAGQLDHVGQPARLGDR